MQQHQDSGVLIGSVDITKSPRLVQRFDIKGMPTLYYFADGGMYQYAPQKPRELNEFIAFVLGGYKRDEENLEVPASSTGVLKVVGDLRRAFHEVDGLNFLLEDFEEILLQRKNAAVLIFGSGVIFGVLLCMLKGVLSSSGSSKKVKKD